MQFTSAPCWYDDLIHAPINVSRIMHSFNQMLDNMTLLPIWAKHIGFSDYVQCMNLRLLSSRSDFNGLYQSFKQLVMQMLVPFQLKFLTASFSLAFKSDKESHGAWHLLFTGNYVELYLWNPHRVLVCFRVVFVCFFTVFLYFSSCYITTAVHTSWHWKMETSSRIS